MAVHRSHTEGGYSNGGTKTYWHTRCDCGGEKVVLLGSLTSGNTKSCGCIGTNTKKHGHAGKRRSPTYHSWTSMIDRCHNPNNVGFRFYGKLGVRVCERWRGPEGFTNFLADMGERPVGTTLDRVRVEEGYGPSNCRWATRQVQARNKRVKLKPNPLLGVLGGTTEWTFCG